MIFVSYSSKDRDTPAFEKLRADLRSLNQPHWVDEALTGGRTWWEEILEQIRSCQVFLPVLTAASLKSIACQREVEYALALRRHVVPVALEEISDTDIPPALRLIHRIDYRGRASDPDSATGSVLRLEEALRDKNATPIPLPDPLPTPPDVPPSYTSIFDPYRDAPELTLADQRKLLDLAREHLDDDELDRHKLAQILKQLRQKEITVTTHNELGELLEQLEGRTSGKTSDNPPIDRDTRWSIKQYDAPRVDTWKLAKQLQSWYEAQGLEAELVRDNGALRVTCRGRTRSRAVGAGAELTTVLEKDGDTLCVSIGNERWKDKATSAGVAAVATVFTAGMALPLFAPSATGAYRQKTLPRKTLRYIEHEIPLCTHN